MLLGLGRGPPGRGPPGRGPSAGRRAGRPDAGRLAAGRRRRMPGAAEPGAAGVPGCGGTRRCAHAGRRRAERVVARTRPGPRRVPLTGRRRRAAAGRPRRRGRGPGGRLPSDSRLGCAGMVSAGGTCGPDALVLRERHGDSRARRRWPLRGRRPPGPHGSAAGLCLGTARLPAPFSAGARRRPPARWLACRRWRLAWPAGAFVPAPSPPALAAWPANSSLSLRTTGASIVEDADLTNSPISWSLAITALLSTPNSFASS